MPDRTLWIVCACIEAAGLAAMVVIYLQGQHDPGIVFFGALFAIQLFRSWRQMEWKEDKRP